MFLAITAERGIAQDTAPNTVPNYAARQLTVRPRAMATGTQNTAAGWQPLDSFEGRKVYVPPKCVGTRRCPLLLYSQPNKEYITPMADKYGIILFPEGVYQNFLNLFNDPRYRKGFDKNLGEFEKRLEQILRQFAIDPDKIVLLGHCAGVHPMMSVAAKNLAVFSRIILLSGTYARAAPNVDPPNGTAEFYLGQGIFEINGIRKTALALQRAGHKVTVSLDLRGHEWQLEQFDAVGRWLRESWATPDPAARSGPDTVPHVPLTAEAITATTRFGTCFKQAPDSITTDARWRHLREVRLPYLLGSSIAVRITMMDIAALASLPPDHAGTTVVSVSDCLVRAGLTPGQFEANRVALAAALAAQSIEKADAEADSVLKRNLAFLKAHPDELRLLKATGILRTP